MKDVLKNVWIMWHDTSWTSLDCKLTWHSVQLHSSQLSYQTFLLCGWPIHLQSSLHASASRHTPATNWADNWSNTTRSYKKVTWCVLKHMVPIASIYLCEAGFSVLVCTKSKYLSRPDETDEMRCALSTTLVGLALEAEAWHASTTSH